MPLKSLELIGYKTFASRSSFEFADSITAVVGPNGSGKSNIADALRWVLGEQSYSLLRGKKTVDMIFSGSQERSPAGMASATVTFDNADGWLPIDFSEVTITRRAYRDGQNEYLINNQKVRLRDVAELLARSGLAERTYTIIGQGLVDAALSLKAEERRRLFEEAAGIGVYRTRRADALRRLDLTRRNLERLGDILSELRPRLRSLDRQARRVEEYEQIQADLHVLLRDWYGFHWHRGQAELAEARETARQREKELLEVRTRKTGFDQQILDLRERIHTQRARLGNWQTELSGLRSQRERISRELAVAGERMRALEERSAAAEIDREALDDEIRLQQERLERTEQEAGQIRQAAEEAEKQATAQQATLEGRTADRDRVLSALAETERSLNEFENRTAARTARLDALGTRLQAQQHDLAEVEAEIESARGEIEEGQAGVDATRERLAAAEREAADAAEETGRQADALRRREEQYESLRAEIAAQTTEAARTAAQLEVLVQAHEAAGGASEGSQALLAAAEAGRIRARGTLGQLVEALDGEAAALAAALGELYDAVFVETDVDVAAALKILSETDAGGTVIPVQPGAARDAQADADSLAAAIQCPPELRPAVDRLFGAVYLADTRSDAEHRLGSLPPGGRIVTRDGILYTAQGQVSYAGGGLRGLVSRPQEIRDLRGRLEALQAALARQEETAAGLAGELEAGRAREKAAREAQLTADQAASRLRTETREAQAAVDQAQNRLAWHLKRSSALQEDIEELGRQANENGGDLSAWRTRVSELRREAEELRSQLEDVSVDEVQEQASHWQTRAAVSRRALDDALGRIDDRKQAVDGLLRRRQELDRQAAEFSDGQGELRREIDRLKAEERQVSEQIEGAKALIEPVEKELREIETRQDSVQEGEAAARQSLSAAERNHSQAQINLARRQENLENLRQRIEDDFGLVSFEYDEDIAGPTPLPLGSFVESLPKVIAVAPELGDSIKRQRAQLRRMGAINPEAKKEYDEVRGRFEFLNGQMDDLNQAEVDILEAVGELDLLMEREFRKTFDEVAREFRETFTRLFGGGSARLVLTDPEDLTETGVDIEAQLPGRRMQGLSLLSGGERSLTAAALVLSLIKVSPTPFCVLDEVDAMLDEANVNRLADLLRELSDRTQFIVITHNRNTVQAAQTIYGITMGRDSTSQVLSLKLDEVLDIV